MDAPTTWTRNAPPEISARIQPATLWIHSYDVQTYKRRPKPPRPDPRQLFLRQKTPHHPRDNHIHKRIDPQRRNQNHDEPHRVQADALLVVDGVLAQGVRDGLPERCDDHDLAVGFAVDDGLSEMRDGEEVEEDGEDYGGDWGGTEGPDGVWGVGGIALDHPEDSIWTSDVEMCKR